jgi:thioredoxin 1
MSSDLIEKIIPIVNLDCASCAKTIQKELVNIPGIKEVKINIILKKVHIKYDAELIDIPQIEREIESIGYRIGYKKYKSILEKILGTFKQRNSERLRVLSDSEFEEYVLKSKHLVVIEFSSKICPTCKALEKILKEIEWIYSDKVYLFKIDINASKLWKVYKIMSTPTLVYFNNGKEVLRQFGLHSRSEVIQQIELLSN